MPPKKKPKDLDWSADANFSKDRSIVFVEHTTECPIFQKKAEECGVFLQQRIPEREIILVRNKYGKVVPREGAFEIGFCQNARTSVHELWSGLTRGPPRRDKFPKDFEMLLPEVQRVLKKFYAEKVPGASDDEEENKD